MADFLLAEYELAVFRGDLGTHGAADVEANALHDL
jgi:hypothetical protein